MVEKASNPSHENAVRQELSINNYGEHIAFLTVDNRKRLNILDSDTMTALLAALRNCAGDEQLRALVLSGAGDKAFIGGADIGEMATLDPDRAEAFITRLHHVCKAIREIPVPVIARIQGYCLGAGLEVAASCDLRIAAADAQFGMPEVRVGLPSVIEAALLPRLIGWGRTSRLLYTGDMIDAKTALDWGLVEEVVQGHELDAAVGAVLNSIQQAGPCAIRAQKALMRQWEALPLNDAVAQGIVSFRFTYQGDEPQRMMQAFLNRKRS